MSRTMHILHRYKYENRGYNTMAEHMSILNTKGDVWWAKFGSGISKEKTDLLKNQIRSGIDTFVILLTTAPSDRRLFYIGKLKDIFFFSSPSRPKETDKIPKYYRTEEYQTWFNFSSLEEADETILDAYSLAKKPDRDLRESLRGQSSLMFIAERDGILYTDTISDDISDLETLPEGSKKRISVNAYERNPVARKRCIEHYGAKCQVCGFDFEKVYGERGKEYIEVHHIKPLSEIGETYQVDPINDLIPVCSNCHRMIHRDKNNVLSIDDLKEILKTNFHKNKIDWPFDLP